MMGKPLTCQTPGTVGMNEGAAGGYRQNWGACEGMEDRAFLCPPTHAWGIGCLRERECDP